MPQPSQIKTFPSRIWDTGSKTFVENVNREQSSDNFTTVAVKDTNEVVGFPDGMAVDEMEHAIKGDLNGVIKPWKMSFYEKHIQEPLAKLGMSAFQPKFITEQKPSADRAFATAFAQTALANVYKPHFSKEEQAAYNLNPNEVVRDPSKLKELFTDPMKRATFAGNLAGMLTGFGAVSAGLKAMQLEATAARVAGASTGFLGNTKLASTAYKAVASAVMGATTAGVYRGISETSHAIDQEHPDMKAVGEAVFHDMAWFGGAGALSATVSKFTGVATSAGIGYTMSKLDGASEPDAILNGGVFAGIHLSGMFGESPEVRKTVVDGLEKSIGDYVKAKNPLVDPHVAAQAGRESVYVHAEKVLADLAGPDNIVRGKDGKPIEFNVDAQGRDAVVEVLKAKESTVKLVDEISKNIVDPGESPQAAQRSAKETKIAVDQYRTSWKRAFETKNVAGMTRANKGLERNKQVPMFESNNETDPYARKIAANPAEIKKVEDHIASMKDQLEILKKEDAQDTEISQDRENEIASLSSQISLSGDVLKIAKIDKIPDFKTTDEAVKFGEEFAGNPHISKMLEKASIEVNAKLDEAPVGQEGMDLGTRAGLLTEAIRASKGELTRAKAKAAIDKLKTAEENARMEAIINDPEVVKARDASSNIPETFTINTPERQAMREKIAQEGYGKGAKVKNRRVDIVLGGPASGKSQVVNPLVKKHGSMIIDSDLYKEKIPEYEGGLGAAAVHKESSNIVEGAILDKALKAGDNIVYPRLGKNPKEIKRLIDLFNANGYEVHLHNVELPVGKAMERAISRFQEHGRFVDPLFVRQVGLQPRETYGMLKTDKGVKSYGSYSADVPKGEAPKELERSVQVGDGERGLQRADSNQDAGTQRGSSEVSKSQRKLNKSRFPAKDKETAKFISDWLFQSERGQSVISNEGQYSRLKSGWPTFLSNKGYTAKELQNIFSKVETGKKLTDKQAEIVRDILNDYDAINTNTEKVIVEAEAWVKDFRARFPEVTDEQIKKLENEIANEELWDEEKYQRAVEKYLTKDTGSQAGAESVSQEQNAAEITPSGQLRHELQPPIKKELFQEKGELFNESGQAKLPAIDELAGASVEVINALSPKTFVPKPALDEIMKMKGGLDRFSFELGSKLDKAVEEMDKMSKADQIAFIDNIKLNKPQATPGLQKLADMMRAAEDARWAEAKKYKESLAYKENHYRVLWKVIPGSKGAGAGGKGFKGLFRRPLQGTKGFAKQATLESMSEGIAMGGEPYSYNPLKMWINSMMDMEKFITSQKMFKSMKDMGYAKFVKTGGNIPDGYVKLNDSIAQRYFPTEQGMVKAGEYYIEENVGRILNNYIGKDWIRTASLGRGLLALKNVTTSIELSLSPFHAAYVSLSTASASVGLGVQKIVNRGIMQRSPQAFLDGLKDIVLAGVSPVDYAKTGGRAIRFISKEGFLNTKEGQDFIKEYPDAKQLMEDLFTGGGKLAMHEDYKINAIRSFRDGIKNKEPWAVAMSSIPAANEVIMKPLFETYIPRLKIGTFLKEYSMELAQRQGELKAGSLTRPELARRVWDSVENRLGEMNFDNLFWDRTMKSALQLTFRSVTWKIGALKNISVSLPEQMIEFKKAYDQGRAPLLTGNMGWLIGVAALATAFSYVTMGLTGQGKPKDLKDIIAPRYDKEGNRISLNTHIKDWVHIMHSPLGFIGNSLSGEIGRAVDVWNNKDFYGVEIYNEDDSAFQKAFDITKSMIPVPFSVSNQVKLKGEHAPAVLKATTVLGVTQPSPGYISNSPAEQKAHEINREKLPVGSRTKEQFDKSNFKKDLRLGYEQTGDMTAIDRAVDEGKITAKEERQILKDAESTPMQRLTKNMSYNEILKVIEKANPEELKDLIPLFNKKIQNKINDATTNEEVDELYKIRDQINKKFSKYNT